MRKRGGFTLVEVLVVLVIVGIIAAIAVQKIGKLREKAVIVSMKSDLKNLVPTQEAYYEVNGAYAFTLGSEQINASDGSGQAEMTLSKDNVVAMQGSSARGWAAIISNPSFPNSEASPDVGSTFCVIYNGDESAGNVWLPETANAGVPYCFPHEGLYPWEE